MNMEEKLELKETLELMKEFEERNNININLIICSDGSFGIDEFWEGDTLFEGSIKEIHIFLKHTKYKLADNIRFCDNSYQSYNDCPPTNPSC